MKKTLALISLFASFYGYAQQLPNSDFSSFTEQNETWNSVGVEPTDWKGSNVNQTVKFIVEYNKKEQLIWQTDENDGVKMVNKYVGVSSFGSNAPAYITLGQPWVYAEATIANCDGGTYGGMDFTYRPDAIQLQYKRTMGEEKTSEIANIIVYAWKGHTVSTVKWQPTIGSSTSQTADMKDRDRDIVGKNTDGVTKTDFVLVSSTEYVIAARNNTSWQELTIPLDYKDTETIPEKINVVLSAADYYNRDNIGKENELDVANVKLIYYHALSNLSYDGEAVAGFAKDITSYDLSSTTYDESKLAYTKKGVGATVEKSYDEISGLLTITVKGNDFSANSESVTTYTLQFKPIVAAEADKAVTPDDTECGKPADASAKLYQTAGGGVSSLVLEEGCVPGVTESITLRDVTCADGTVSAEKKLSIGGQAATVAVSGKVTDGVLRANVTVEIAGGETYSAVVSDVRTLTIDGTETVEQPEQPGIWEVKIAREFKQGWNTWCMPCDVNISGLGEEAKAQEFSECANGTLNFKQIEDTLKCGVPYLVWFPETCTSDISFYATTLNLNIESVMGSGTGGFTFLGNYAANFDMEGKYGVADYKGDGIQRITKGLSESTLPATCAYFTSSDENATGMALNLEGETTAISTATVNGLETDAPVYNLQGIRLSNGPTHRLPAGVYVKAGKKLIVK